MCRTAFLSLVLFVGTSSAADTPRVFELHAETAAPGKQNALQTKLREKMPRLWERHGMTHLGTWTPIDKSDNRVFYLLGWPDRKARSLSWDAYHADPAVKGMSTEVDREGKVVVGSESWLLTPTSYSPKIQRENKGPRVFELRFYTATPDNLEALSDRFRDYTCKLFEKHGMTNVAYWTPLKEAGNATDKFVYLLAHKDEAAAKASLAAFQADPEWIKVKERSEKKAGGPLTVKDGIKSVLLKATDESPIK
ncbi:MAG: NIPSNAP family protein [Gemmataceae bacterium]